MQMITDWVIVIHTNEMLLRYEANVHTIEKMKQCSERMKDERTKTNEQEKKHTLAKLIYYGNDIMIKLKPRAMLAGSN